MSKRIPDKWLYIPSILLGLYFFIRLVDQSKLMHMFPFDFANDIPAFIASLFFLAQCGFNKFCPYWYNGFVSFHTFFPGWQFFTYPLYKLFEDFLISTYVSIVLIYILSFTFIFVLGGNEKFSITKRVAFFLFFFANAINVGNFFKLGRVTSLFGWCMFLGVAMFAFYYRRNKLDKRFILFIPLYCFTILSHPQEAVFSSILVLSLFLGKRFYEKSIIVLSVILSFVLTSFWWIPFVLNLSRSSMMQHTHQSTWLWSTSGAFLLTSIAAFVVSLIFFVAFYYYWLSKNKSWKELLFFSPIIVLNTLFFFRVIPLIPVLNNISPDPYIVLFIFFIIYFFLGTNPAVFKKMKKLVPYALTGTVLISLGFSHFKTPYFIDHTPVNKDTLDILEYVDGKFMFTSSYENSYTMPYYSYAPIYLNLSTAGGYYPHIITDEYYWSFGKVDDYLAEGDCEKFLESARFFNVTNFVAYEDECKRLEECGLKKIREKDIVCLYKDSLALSAS